jgi:hypothetical protein
MLGTTVWEECQRRDKCRAGLQGVSVQHPTLGVCTIRCSEWAKENGACNLLLGVVLGQEQPAPRSLDPAGLHAVPSLGELLAARPTPATQFVGADECTLLSPWPVTCCRPRRLPTGEALPLTHQHQQNPIPPEDPMPTDYATSIWDEPINVAEQAAALAATKPKRKPRKPPGVKAPTLALEGVTVQEAWEARLCRYGLVNLPVTHPAHGRCVIASTAFETADATSNILLLWLIVDKDDASLLEDFHQVPAAECTLTREWPERCCRPKPRPGASL